MPLEEIAPDVVEFVDSYIDHFVAWDILSLFHENPFTDYKLSDIALEAGRRPAIVEPLVESLVRKGILKRSGGLSDEASYRYAANNDFRTGMSRFLAATRERATRLAIVSRILRKES